MHYDAFLESLGMNSQQFAHIYNWFESKQYLVWPEVYSNNT